MNTHPGDAWLFKNDGTEIWVENHPSASIAGGLADFIKQYGDDAEVNDADEYLHLKQYDNDLQKMRERNNFLPVSTNYQPCSKLYYEEPWCRVRVYFVVA